MVGELGFPEYFADAEKSFKEADYVIFGVPYDRTGSFRKGTALGPRGIREGSWNFEPFNPRAGVEFPTVAINDFGDIDTNNEDTPEQMVEKVYEQAKYVADAGKFPVMLGGEHNATPGVVRALAGRYPDLGVIFIDAHIDYRDEYRGSRNNHACASMRSSDDVDVKRIISYGLRSFGKEEYDEADANGFRYYSGFVVKERGIEKTLDEGIAYLEKNGARHIYLSLDIDGLDPAYAPGTGTPEPFGLTDWDVLRIIERTAPMLVGFDVMEVCPPYDNGNTAALAAKLVREVISFVEASKRKK